MILLIFLCIKLTIIHFSTSDLGYKCFKDDFGWYTNLNPTIFLNNDYGNDYNERLQLNFECKCRHFYDIQFGSLEEAYKYDYVIQFAVLDYNDGKLPKNFEYAGNITKTEKVVCHKSGKPEPEFDCNEIANIVSSPLLTLHGGHLYNYVQKMEIINKTDDNDCLDPVNGPVKCKPFVHARPIDLTTVVICRPELRHPKEAKIYVYAPNRTSLTVVQVSCDYINLDSYNDQILAMLAPKPVEISTEYLVPTIFYKTPYIFSENQSAFPNSMNVVPWRLLKYGFLKFIQTVGWRRVAVVTDDSEYSLEFETELTALLYKERIVFTVIRCEDMNCEMDKIKEEVHRVRASIVVANVEAEHAKYLIKNGHSWITWIVRDMDAHPVEFPNRHVFFISLRAVDYTEDCGQIQDDNILNGLSTVVLAYKELGEADFELKKREFYRHFTNKVKEISTRKTEAIVVVYSGTGAEISKMYVNGTGAQLLSYKDPFGSRKPSDGTSHCLVTSYDYFKPCEDDIVLFFVSILLVFVITFLLVLCYFEKTSPLIDVRYRNL